jgi:C4-type Zn-finger protein
MLYGRQKKQLVITCPVCGAEMKIIRTQITLPLVV